MSWAWQPLLPAAAQQPAGIDASTDSTLAATFQTRTIRSRKSLHADWIASMAPAASQPAVVPASAWMVRPVTRRRDTDREIVKAPPLHWQYIAPTVAAILPAPKVIKVEFQRELRVVQPLAQYPATPPTGPPYPSWLAPTAFRVSHSKRLVPLPEQDSYPAASVTPSEDSVSAEPFQTWRGRSRRSLSVDWIAALAAYPVVATIYLDAAQALRRRETARRLIASPVAPVYPQQQAPAPYLDAAQSLRRRGTERRLTLVAIAPVYPQAAAPPEVTFAAVVQTRARRRSGGSGGFVAVDVFIGPPGAGTTAAVYPSYLPAGFNKRRGTGYRLARTADAPVYPATPAGEISQDSISGEAFQTWKGRSRKALRVVEVPVYPAGSPPETTPAVYPSFVPTGYNQRRETARKLRSAAIAHEFPATPPPVPPVVAAFTLNRAIRRKSLGQGFVAVDVVSGAVSTLVPYPSYVPSGFNFRRGTERRLLTVLELDRYPNIPPAAEQPPTAFKLAEAHIRGRLKRHLRVAVGPLHVEAAVVAETPRRRGGGRPRKAHVEERLPSQYKRLEEMVDEVSAELAYKQIQQTAPAPVKAQAKAIVLPAKAVAVDWGAIEADTARVGKLLTLWAAEQRRLAQIRDEDEWLMWE